jgi:glutamate racemase
MSKTIGVFDSGIGGLSIANAIQSELPTTNVIFKNDSANVPYGTKSNDELLSLCLPLLKDLAEKSDILVIACNTLSTNLLPEIQAAVDIPVIGVEPMLQKAQKYSITKTICVCATPRTLSSKRYAQLKQDFAKEMTIIEPDCSNWSKMIETYEIDQKSIQKIIKNACKNHADVIVLGCTHYHWIAKEINKIATKYGAIIISPEDEIAERVRTLLN